MIDCNSIRLSIGEEIFVTPHVDQVNEVTKRRLSPSEAFQIPPQQFAFLLTEEQINVPQDAMAFISMRATYKMQGLINVSGFHVDPGWRGKLTFAVYNAGPSSVHLERGMGLFLIWYADLNEASEKFKQKPGSNTIEPKTIIHLTAATDSLYAVNQRLLDEIGNRQEETNRLREQVHGVEKSQVRILATVTLIIGLVVSLGLWVIRQDLADIYQAGMSKIGSINSMKDEQRPKTMEPISDKSKKSSQ